ncbi:MAG: FlgD immunoglobulin-like domain containing protein [Candidatus Firestonebacteria bacterium]
MIKLNKFFKIIFIVIVYSIINDFTYTYAVTYTLDSTGNVGGYNSIAIDSNNKVHIGYYDVTNGDLKYATNISGSWVTSTLDSSGTVGWWSSIAIDSNNKVHIGYYDATNGDLKYATNISGSWVTSTLDSSGTVGWYNSIAIDSNNKVHISYMDYTNADLKYATNTSGSWVYTTLDDIGSSLDGSQNRTSITIDSNNKVHISYAMGFGGNLKYATNTSGSWVCISLGIGFTSSIAIDNNNKVYISYNGTDLRYGTNASGSWVTSTLDSAFSNSFIAIDNNNKIHISCFDSTNADLKYVTNAGNTAPTLSWTGEANYTSDGINPEIGNTSSTFIYRIKYTDTDNDAPASGYPKVHIKKAGVEISGSPFTMSYVSGSYSTGAIYTYSKTLSSLGTDYTYYFEAQDVWNEVATGTPTIAVDSPDVNNAPALSWTGETNYVSDGLDPHTGNTAITFTYRVKYTDADALASGYPKVHIKKAGSEISGSPFTMTYVSGTYSGGAIYTYSKILSTVGIDYTYYFEAQDVYNEVATGIPTTSVDAPDVSAIPLISPNTAPIFSWTGETNYTANGIYPTLGNASTTFVFRVKYTDADNDAPASGYPKLYIKKGGVEISGSPFAMVTVDSSLYSAGPIYTYSTVLTKSGADYTYYFEAKDVLNGLATGIPTNPFDAPDVNVIQANQDTNIVSEDGTSIDIPKDTLNPGVAINITIPSVIPEGEVQNAGYSVKQTNITREITTSDGSKNFNKEIKISIPFKDSDVAGINKQNLKLFYYSEERKMWILIPSAVVDTNKNTISILVTHLTIFRIMALEPTSAVLVLYNNLFDPANNEKLYVRYDIVQEVDVTVTVYSIKGQKIKELFNGRKTAGSYTDLTWDGKNEDGEVVASGIYVVYISAGDFRDKKKVVVVK